MHRKAISRMMLALLLVSMLTLAFKIESARTELSDPPAIEWSQTYGGTDDDVARSVVETDDGGYATAGYTHSFGAGASDFWLVKTDSEGNAQWNKTYGGTDDDEAYFVIGTGDEGYALAGSTESFGPGWKAFWLVKTDADGNMEWNRTYGGAHNDVVWSMVQTDDGGYTIAGETDSFGAGGWDFWLVKIDADGNVEWDQTYGRRDPDVALSVVETSDGGYALAGWTYSFGAGSSDFWLVKLAGPAPQIVEATVDINPKALNLKSKGKWTTCYIELPQDYKVEIIDLDSIMLNDAVGIDPDAPTEIGDYDDDGVLDLMVKFDRQEVIALLSVGDATLTVTGEVNGTYFEGSDTIRVIGE